ncbi:MAG: hypothetical protein ABSF26_18750 [Thermoguttaceae bacterium]|jgi:hypothetical protein
MARRLFCLATALVLASAWCLSGREARGQLYQWASSGGAPNAYVPAQYPDGTALTLYPSPRPAPPLVGYTYVPYEPLAPHEFLYTHHRTYDRCNPGNGVTHTSVLWWHQPNLCPFPGHRWLPPINNCPPAKPSYRP